MNLLNNRKQFYNTILSQTLSTCGEYLMTGNNYGEIFVYSIGQICFSPSEQQQHLHHHHHHRERQQQQQQDSKDSIDQLNNSPKMTTTMLTTTTEKQEPTNTAIASNKPCQIFKIDNTCQIYSLMAYKNLILVGTMSTVTAYAWSKHEITKKCWECKLVASGKETLEQGEVNSMWLDKLNGYLYVGCGDSVIYVLDLEKACVLRDFIGHKDYIHCVHGCYDSSSSINNGTNGGDGNAGDGNGTGGGGGGGGDNHRIFSASEDGTIKFWDYREKRSIGQLEPWQNPKLNRSEFGKWQGTVSVTDDWLICGGGPKFSLWHLRSMECTTVYPFAGTTHVSGFLDDIILVAGDFPQLHQYTINGDVTAEVPVSAASVYSVVWQFQPTKLMSIGGSSNCLDICTDFNYKDIVLSQYESLKK